MLNNQDGLFLDHYYATPLYARTTGQQTVIQDGDVKLAKDSCSEGEARNAYGISENKRKRNVLRYTVPLKSKLPVASRFRRDANRVARYAIRVARESSKRKMSGIN